MPQQEGEHSEQYEHAGLEGNLGKKLGGDCPFTLHSVHCEISH